MMKKMVSIVICMLVALPIFSTAGADIIIKDNLDQQQIEHDYVDLPEQHPYYGYRVDGQYQWGQSFIPTFPILTRIKLWIFDWGGDPFYDLIIGLRKELNGGDIVNITFSSNQIPDYYSSENNWIEINFRALEVTPGDTYYIVVHAPSGDGEIPGYGWTFGQETSYTNGEAWIARENSDIWGNHEQGGFNYPTDFCFETYGLNIPDNWEPIP